MSTCLCLSEDDDDDEQEDESEHNLVNVDNFRKPSGFRKLFSSTE